MKIWNTYSSYFSLVGNTGGFIAARTLNKSLLVSGGSDLMVRVWNVTNNAYNSKFNMSGHTNTIFDIEILANDTVASCSQDGTIRFWDANSGVQLSVFNLTLAVRKCRLISNGNFLVLQVSGGLRILALNISTIVQNITISSINTFEILANGSIMTGTTSGILACWSGFSTSAIGSVNVGGNIRTITDLSKTNSNLVFLMFNSFFLIVHNIYFFI